jgi:ABC-2 type transport system permease protein
MTFASANPVAELAIHRGGPFSALARAQYRALAAMRWAIFRNTLRTTRGAMEAGARAVTYIIYGCMSFGLAMGFGASTFFIADAGKWEFIPIVFWALFLAWQVVPVSIASFQEQFDISSLLRFPVGFGAFYLLHLIFGMVDVSTILGGFCCLGILVGATLARPGMFAPVALALLVFAVFNVFLVRAIAAWIDRWMAQRRTREIVGALFFAVLLAMQLLNPAYWQQKHPHVSAQSRAEGLRWLDRANAIQRWLPPGLAASEVQRSADSRPLPAVEAVGLLGIYALAAGALLGIRLRGEYRGENFSDAPSPQKAERRTRLARSSSAGWSIEGSGPVAAVMEKEWRVLMRAMPLIYGLAAPLIMVFVLSGLFLRHGSPGGHSMSISLMVSLAYAMVGFTQLFYNNLGPEGPAIQVLFLCSTPMRTIMMAKNLFHSLLFLVDAVLVAIIASLRIGWPTAAAIGATIAWVAFALPVHLAAGNAFSLVMPYRMNLGRMTRQRGSQLNALFSMLIQLAVLGVGALVFAVCSFLGNLWMAVPVFLVFAVAAIFAWTRQLDHVDAIAARRRESLMATLVRTE